MQRLLAALISGLFSIAVAHADSKVHDLATNTTSPLPAGSCIYVDQGPGTDTKLCSGWAAALGAASAANPTATIGTAAVNGSAATFMRSDGAPAIPACSSSVFGACKVDGTTITASGGVISAAGSVANPTGTIGLSAVNGSASSAIRSDGAPALSQAIVPTWTGAHTFAKAITDTFVNASVLGAAIANAGTGGTPGAATVTGTTGTGTKVQVAVTITDTVVTAAVNNAGDGSGTPGPVTITGTTGTGTLFQATGTIDGGGLLTDPLVVTVIGSYTVDPTTTGEPVTSNAGLVGATVDLTLTGKLASVDSITVAGLYTVPPTDPTQEPVTGGGLSGAMLNLGMSFAPAIIASDPTSGVIFDQAGRPGLALGGSPSVTVQMLPDVILTGLGFEGFRLSGAMSGDVYGAAFGPIVGGTGAGQLVLEGVGSGNFAGLSFTAANGVKLGETAALSGDVLGNVTFAGHRATVAGSRVTGITSYAAEDFDDNHGASSFRILTTDLTQSAANRIFIDGSGTVNVPNNGLVVGTPPGGSQGAGTASAEIGYYGPLLATPNAIVADTSADALTVSAGNGLGTGNGGGMTIVTGNGGATGNGGGLALAAGGAIAGGNGAGGTVSLQAGSAYGSGIAGDLTILGGINLDAGGTGRNGNINITARGGDGSGASGNINITLGSGAGAAGQLIITPLPSAEPSVTDAIWVDSGTLVKSGHGAPVEHVSYQPGLLTAVNATKAAFHKVGKTSTVDNLEGSAATFTCAGNPTVTMFECGTSTTCTSPTTIGTVTITAAGTVVDGTVSNPTITAGDYVAFSMTAGTCASVDLAATAQVHVN